MGEDRHDGPAPLRPASRHAMGRHGVDFVHDLCRDHAEWADDRTLGGATPLGWRPLVRSLFEGMRDAMADAPGARVALARLEGCGNHLLVEVRNHEVRPTPTAVLLALERMIEEAERCSAEICPFCGRDFGPGAAADGRMARHRAAMPTCEPSPTMRLILEGGGDP